MNYIEVDNVTFKYEEEPVLENISFQVKAGEFVILTGENGAAKTTLLRLVLGLLKPDNGAVKLAKKKYRRRQTAYRICSAADRFFQCGFSQHGLGIGNIRQISKRKVVQAVTRRG